MNIIDMFSTKFNELSCNDLKKRREEIDSEINRRRSMKIKEINLRYKEKEREIKSRFNEIAKELGTVIPIDSRLTEDIEHDLASCFISIANRYRYYNDYTLFGKTYVPDVSDKLLDILSVLKEDKEHNLILMLAMQLELKKLENEKLLEISKIAGVD